MRCLLFFLTLKYKRQAEQQGFTLIELITVIILVAITATVAITSYNGLQNQGRYDVTKFEMNQIRTALLQFRQDSGTRSFPTQGSYDCTDRINGGNDTDPNSAFVFPPSSGNNNAEKIDWCQHPANFWMLFEDPFGRDKAQQWNRDTKRGWHGPYLQRKNGFLTLANNVNNNNNTPNLDNINNALWAIANPYVITQQNTGVQWSLQLNSVVLEKAGTPYAFFVNLTNTPENYIPRLVSAGEDGVFEVDAHNALVCNQVVNGNGEALDDVLCL